MKKHILLICLAVSIGSMATAQSFKLGIKGGLNFPSADALFGDGAGLDSNVGYHAGAFALIKVSKIGIQPEAYFNFNSFDFVDINSGINVQNEFSYLNVPIVVKFYLIKGLNLQAGPQFGFLLGADSESDFGSLDISEFYKSTDVSATVGAGLDLPFGLDVHARYNFGLVDNLEVNPGDAANNNSFQISIGYALLKKG